jgi:outer membrane protein assembly factor BamB
MMPRFGFLLMTLALASTVMATGVVAGDDWGQWRGPTRDGWAAAKDAPADWPEKLTKKWTAPAGEGYSSPVVLGSLVFVHSRRDPEEVVTAFDLATGAVRWTDRYAAPFAKNHYAVNMAKGPNSTPVAADGRVFTLGVTAVLTSYDAATGRVRWRKDFSKEIDTGKLFCGTAMSPVLDRGLLFVHVGDDRRGAVLAFDAATGDQRWRLDADGPGYASPVIADIAGRRQLITLTDKSIIGVAVDRGVLLWRVPFPDEWNENIVTPIVSGNRVIVAGVRQGTVALDVTHGGAGGGGGASDGEWKATESWRNKDITMYMSSPILDNGKLYGLSSKRKGQFFCLDAATGRALWTTEGREGQSAAVIASGAHLLMLTTDGDLIITRRDAPTFTPLRRYELSESATWPHPALIGSQLLIRDASNLTLWTTTASASR